MDRIWTRHWPPGIDEAALRLPREPLSVSLKTHARRAPDKPALVFYGRTLTWGELDGATDRFAGWLRRRGVRPGDRVAIFMENCPQFAIAYFGGLRAGAINVCLNPMHKAAELAHELEDSGARALVTSDQGWAVVEPIRAASGLEAVATTAYRDFLPGAPALPPPPSFLEPPRPCPGTEDLRTLLAAEPPIAGLVPRAMEDTALLQYTSGTTGAPKGAELTHGNLAANCELTRLFCGLGPDEVWLGVLPWFHISGMHFQLNMLAYTGATVVALGRFDPETYLAAVPLYRCTATTLIATINVAIVNSAAARAHDLSSLRVCFSGGAPVPAEIARRWEALTGRPLIEGYGMSETTAPTHMNPPQRVKYGAVGVPYPLTEARVVSLEDGVTEMPVGQPGEILVRGPMVMKGYWRRPDATAQALEDGWLRTGDIGHVDAEGYFTIDERKKDMVKASGYSVFPAEVEALMYAHPDIAEVGVIGVPDAYRGEDVMAFVVLRAGAEARVTERGLVEWCRAAMAVYKAPRRIRFVPALPRTGSGKILKRALREMAAG